MGKLLRVTVWLGLVLGVIIGGLRLVAIRWWQIPNDDPILTTSLAPTLRAGDWVLLWRATEPRFGSLVVCPDPDNAGRFVVGRIMGESNDRISIQGTRISVNDHDARSESVCTFIPFSALREQDGTRTREPSTSTTQTRQTFAGCSVSP